MLYVWKHEDLHSGQHMTETGRKWLLAIVNTCCWRDTSSKRSVLLTYTCPLLSPSFPWLSITPVPRRFVQGWLSSKCCLDWRAEQVWNSNKRAVHEIPAGAYEILVIYIGLLTFRHQVQALFCQLGHTIHHCWGGSRHPCCTAFVSQP